MKSFQVVLFQMENSRLLFFIFVFSTLYIVPTVKVTNAGNLPNLGPQVMEATALLNLPQPLRQFLKDF